MADAAIVIIVIFLEKLSLCSPKGGSSIPGAALVRVYTAKSQEWEATVLRIDTLLTSTTEYLLINTPLPLGHISVPSSSKLGA